MEWGEVFGGASSAPPAEETGAGIPSGEDLQQQARVEGNEHLSYEQPDDPTRSEYYSKDYLTGTQGQSQDGREADRLVPIPETGIQQQTQQGQSEGEIDFWTVPSNLPPQLQLQEYQQRLTALRGYLESPDYLQEVAESKQQMLTEAQAEIKDFAVAYKALQENPKAFMMQYLPEVLMEYGVSPVMNMEQIGQQVRQDLVQMFGEDYQQRTDASEIFVPGSYSSMVYQQQQQLYSKYQEQNAKNQAMLDNWGEMVANGQIGQQPQEEGFGQMPLEAQAEQLADEYTQVWQPMGYTAEEFADFVDRAQEMNMDLSQVHRLVYFDSYLSEAYKQGVEQGKQAYYQQIRSSGNANPVQRIAQQPVNYGTDEDFEKEMMLKQISHGGLPMY